MLRSNTHLVFALLMISINFCVQSTVAFTAALPQRQSAALSMAPLSSEEIFARAQQRKDAEEDERAPPPMLYDDVMLKDMQGALLLMEKRVSEGPGSLSSLEVEQLNAQLSKIMAEMRVNEHMKPPRPAAVAVSSTTPAPVYPTAPPVPESIRVETLAAGPKVIDIDTPSDEGEEYKGVGGMGQAADTTNTYVIPGMDEMSPAEYQKELQRSVIERQSVRKKTGVTGNRSSWDYMNSLTGERGVLKKEPPAEE